MKKIISLMLSMILLITVLSACTVEPADTDATEGVSDTDESSTAEETESEPEESESDDLFAEKTLMLVDGGVSKVTIVYPARNSKLSDVADLVAYKIESTYGVSPDCVRDDQLLPDDERTEILIGATNRQQSADESGDLVRDEHYLCRLSGNKLVLQGKTNDSTVEAVNYFIKHYLMDPVNLNSLVYSDIHDFFHRGQYVVNLIKCGDTPLTEYTIVYPKGSITGEYYVALNLKYSLLTRAGIDVPVKDDSSPATGKEILVGQTNRGITPKVTEGIFSVKVIDGNICISAADFFGFLSADHYLYYELFAPNTSADALGTDFSHSAKADTIPERNGKYRVMFNNCWGLGDFANRDEYAAAMFLAYQSDVVALNEYWDQYRAQHVIAETLEANGYEEVKVTATNVMPIFYRPDKLKLLDSTYVHLTWYANDSYTTTTKADDSKGITIAVFEGLDENGEGNGDRFIILNTHLTSNYLDGVNGWQGHGYHSRLLNIDTAWETLQPFLKKYPDASVLFGCDYNATASSDECKKIKSLGFKDCHDIAEVTDNDCSSHGYPNYDANLGYFVSVNISNATYAASIDHIFQYGDTIVPKTYDTILTFYSGLFSDHAPLLLDFDVV